MDMKTMIPAITFSVLSAMAGQRIIIHNNQNGGQLIRQIDIVNLQSQLNSQVAAAWPNSLLPIPVWPVELVMNNDPPAYGEWLMDIVSYQTISGVDGFHTWDAQNNRAYMNVYGGAGGFSFSSVTQTMSHELIESIVNPYTSRQITVRYTGTVYCANLPAEIVDYVNHTNYMIGVTVVADFLFPSWYVAYSPGPWDQAGVLGQALVSGPGDPPPHPQYVVCN